MRKVKNTNKTFWTRARLNRAKKILNNSTTISSALMQMQNEFKAKITDDAVRRAFNRNGYQSKLGEHLKNEYRIVKEELKDEKDQIEFVVKLIQKSTKANKNKFITFKELCNILDSSPKKVEVILDKAKNLGYKLDVTGDIIYLDKSVEKQVTKKQIVNIPKTKNNVITFACISDTHFGSKHCMKEELKHFVNLCYNEYGITTIFHSGDCLAGNKVYKGQPAELETWSCHEQCEIFAEHLPKYKNLRYTSILGNHDVDFIKSNGTDPAYIMSNMREDVNFIGTIKGRCILGKTGIEIELLHIKSSARTRSYGVEQHVFRSMAPSDFSEIVAVGHMHSQGYFEIQDSHVLMVPCWEGANIFTKYYDLHPSIGGVIVSLGLDESNNIVAFDPRFRKYDAGQDKKAKVVV